MAQRISYQEIYRLSEIIVFYVSHTKDYRFWFVVWNNGTEERHAFRQRSINIGLSQIRMNIEIIQKYGSLTYRF